jgi:hypothetical protein
MRARFFALLVALLMIGTPALAAFTISVDAPDEMFAGDTAEATVMVVNSGAESFFSASQIVAAPPANMWTAVEGSVAIRIPYGGTGTFKVKLAPSVDARPGSYSFTITVREQTTDTVNEASWTTTMRQRVAAAMIRTLNLSCTSCTGDKVVVTAQVENVGTAPLTGVTVPITVTDKSVVLNVGDMALEAKKVVTTEASLTGLVPGEYSVRAELVSNGQSLDARAASFTIPHIQNVEQGKSEGFTPWSKTVMLTATNKGNSPDHATLTATVTSSPWVSISYSQPPSSQSGNEAVWTAQLAPGASMTVSYTEFYWPIPVIIVVAVLVAVYAYLWTTAVVLDKKLTKRGSEWAVSLTVTNKGTAVDGVVVSDRVPAGFALGGSFETLKPIARRMEGGIELLWRVGGMRKGEQRVLHYRLNGDRAVRLPPARLRAKRGEKTLLVSSKEISVPGTGAPPKLKVEVEK